MGVVYGGLHSVRSGRVWESLQLSNYLDSLQHSRTASHLDVGSRSEFMKNANFEVHPLLCTTQYARGHQGNKQQMRARALAPPCAYVEV